MDVAGAHAVWHAIDTTIRLLDALGDDNIPVNAALYGQRDRLAGIARRLAHDIGKETPSW
jgi:hypothetical protein